MHWPFQKPGAPQSPSAVCSKLQAPQDAECEELLRQTEEYEALRFLKDRKVQVSKSCVYPPKASQQPCVLFQSFHFCSMV